MYSLWETVHVAYYNSLVPFDCSPWTEIRLEINVFEWSTRNSFSIKCNVTTPCLFSARKFRDSKMPWNRQRPWVESCPSACFICGTAQWNWRILTLKVYIKSWFSSIHHNTDFARISNKIFFKWLITKNI